MARCVGAAATLPEGDRKDLAIQALARSTTISDLSVQHSVSRKFVYQQARKAGAALDEVFLSGAPGDDVVFHLTVSKTWLRQVIVALTLICRSSYRGVVEFLRDLLGVPISIGTVHHALQLATRQAGIVNHDQDLSGILVGLHDEIFQGTLPVLAGVDAASTYCYLLAVAGHRDADTWGVHLLDTARQGLKPDYTIADAGQGFALGKRPPGTIHRAMAMCFTSRVNTKAWPTRCRASPRAPGRGARSWRPRLAARVSLVRTTNWPLSLRGRPRPRRKGWPATSERSLNG